MLKATVLMVALGLLTLSSCILYSRAVRDLSGRDTALERSRPAADATRGMNGAVVALELR